MRKKIKVEIIEESLWDRLPQHVKDEINGIINSKPKEMVEVVRCKECKRRGIVYECPMCYTEDWYDEDEGYDSWDVDKTIDDGFCHCGEKMAAEVTDEQ